jgi:phage baseplate assembly protein W
MDSFLKIPVTLSFKARAVALERVSVEDSVKQFFDLLISTRQGECSYNQDFGYELWSSEFEPIINIQQWQPVFMEQIKNLLEKYESRITSVKVGEPEIKAINKKRKTDRDYSITISVDYKIVETGESFDNVKISFEY